MTKPCVHVLRLVAVCSILTVGSDPARADDPDPREGALAHVKEGNRLLDAHDPEGALNHFRRAFILVRSPKLQFNFGQALAMIPGREAEAYDAFELYLASVPAADPVTRSQATREMEGLRPRLAFVSISANEDGAAVFVDGQPRGTTPLSHALPAPPGEHEIRLVKPGFVDTVETISLNAGQPVTRDCRLRSASEAAADSPRVPAAPIQPLVPTAPAPPLDSPRPMLVARTSTSLSPAGGASGGRPAGWVLAGLGVASATAGVFVYRAGAAKLDHINAAANQQPTAGQYDDSDGNYRMLGNSGIGLMIGGALAVAAGVAIYVLNRDHHEEAPATETAAVTASAPGSGPVTQVGGAP